MAADMGRVGCDIGPDFSADLGPAIAERDIFAGIFCLELLGIGIEKSPIMA